MLSRRLSLTGLAACGIVAAGVVASVFHERSTARAQGGPQLFAQQRLFQKKTQPMGPEMVGHAVHTIPHGGLQRRYFVYVPASVDRSKPVPVMLNFHGGLGRPEIQRKQSQMNLVADKEGFLVVYPEGTGRLNLLFWNAGSCCGSAEQTNVDDVGFLKKLLDDLPKRYQIDSQRIYATGMSNGAMFCHRLAMELSDRIAAIGPVAGAIAVDGPQPKRPVPVVLIHGMHDPYSPYNGGRGPLGGYLHRSVRTTLDWWIKADHCGSQPAKVEQTDVFTMTRWEPEQASAGAPIVHYAITDGGHTWPGGQDVTPQLKTGKMIESFSASQAIWDFCKEYSVPAKTGNAAKSAK